jgi:tRNA-specific 2-thiouridylase
VKARYRQADQDCTVTLRPDGGLRVTTDLEQRAVTPGQSAVLYDGEVCLGGAVIASTTTLAGTDATAGRKL